MTLKDYFSTGPPHERPVFEAVLAVVEQAVGPVVVEPVSVGIFLKRARTFAQLRPMQRWVALSFSLGHRVDHRLIVRKPQQYNGRWWHTLNVASPADLDAQIAGWLAEAYHDSPE